VYVTDTKPVFLLPAEAIGHSIAIHQSIEGYYSSQTYFLEAIVEAGGKGIFITGLSSFGTQVYSLAFHDSVIEFSSAAAGGIKPEYMLADFELCYFPSEQVASMLRNAGFGFEEIMQEKGFTRRILNGDKVIIEILRDGNVMQYRNLLRGYGYSIQEEPLK